MRVVFKTGSTVLPNQALLINSVLTNEVLLYTHKSVSHSQQPYCMYTTTWGMLQLGET